MPIKLLANQRYKGWDMYWVPAAPVTGTHRAEKHGVALCASTREQLERIIDLRMLTEDAHRARTAQ